jgi:hypothetical protein
VLINALATDFEEGELERLVAALPDYQGALNRFGQMVVGRYLRELPDGIVREGANAGDHEENPNGVGHA